MAKNNKILSRHKINSFIPCDAKRPDQLKNLGLFKQFKSSLNIEGSISQLIITPPSYVPSFIIMWKSRTVCIKI